MILERAEVIAKLAAAGIPTGTAEWLVPDQINGVKFGTVSREFMQRAWNAFIAMLEADPDANLTMRRDIGGGVMRTVPRYIAPGGVCRHWTVAFNGFLMLCFIKANIANPHQENDGYAVAPVVFTSIPRAENLNRAGRHARIIAIDEHGEVYEFEEGDGDPEPTLPAEFASVTSTQFV